MAEQVLNALKQNGPATYKRRPKHLLCHIQPKGTKSNPLVHIQFSVTCRMKYRIVTGSYNYEHMYISWYQLFKTVNCANDTYVNANIG